MMVRNPFFVPLAVFFQCQALTRKHVAGITVSCNNFIIMTQISKPCEVTPRVCFISRSLSQSTPNTLQQILNYGLVT